MKFTYYGHACFAVTINNCRLLGHFSGGADTAHHHSIHQLRFMAALRAHLPVCHGGGTFLCQSSGRIVLFAGRYTPGNTMGQQQAVFPQYGRRGDHGPKDLKISFFELGRINSRRRPVLEMGSLCMGRVI